MSYLVIRSVTKVVLTLRPRQYYKYFIYIKPVLCEELRQVINKYWNKKLIQQNNLWKSGQTYFEFTEDTMLCHGLVKLLSMLFLSVTNFLLSVIVNSYSYFQNLFRPDHSEVFPQHLLLQNSSVLASCYCRLCMFLLLC